MTRLLALALALALGAPPAARAQSAPAPIGSSEAGTSMANFLKIPVGARAAAMGGAFVALADDASALFWNPGGLGTLAAPEAVLHTTDWIVGTRMSYAGAAVPLRGRGTLGLSVHAFSSGDIEETTLDAQQGTGRTFAATNTALGLSYGRALTDRFAAGATLKLVSETLDDVSASAVAVDVGSVFRTDFAGQMRIGFALSNLGSRMRLGGTGAPVPDPTGTGYVPNRIETAPWELPLLFRFGVASDVAVAGVGTLVLSGEVFDSRDFGVRVGTGAELRLGQALALRGGYTAHPDGARLSAGAGLTPPPVAGLGLAADYAYEHLPALGGVQSLSVGVRF